MCGIIGITGRPDAVEEIMAGLGRLEYRGYDSAGIVAASGGTLRVVKRSGKLENLRSALDGQGLAASTGLGHTRWATHGAPNDRNAHPHLGPQGRVAVIHNGIIENYEALKRTLSERTYGSDTDTEVVAHLLEEAYVDGADFFEAFRSVVAKLDGAFALCAMALDLPGEFVVAKRDSPPLILGHENGVGYCASDP
ncbi:MAG: glucosamine--fructose-6-phosphate aminotransferase (isomerizing), partial [Glaciecola sp.]